MPGVRLRNFLIISLVLHVVALFIGALVFQIRSTLTNPQLIDVGAISKYKDPGVGSGGSVGSPPKETTRLEKKVVNSVIKKKAEKEISKKKEIDSQVDKSLTEQSTIVSSQNLEAEQTNEPLSNTIAGMGFSKGGKGVGSEGSGLGTKGSGQGVEVGYPDYKINPKPKYPVIARRNGYEGAILLRVWVLESGKVGKIEMEKSSGHEILDNSALQAVRNWIFIPGKRNGIPISSWVKVPIKFQLSNG